MYFQIVAKVKKIFPVEGMSCAACASSVQSILESQEGVSEANANYANNEAYIEYDEGLISNEALKSALNEVGYDLILESEEPSSEIDRIEEIRKRLIWSALFTVPVVLISMFLPSFPYDNYVMWILTTPVLFIFGRGFFTGAWKHLKNGMFNMDTLIALSTGVSYLFSAVNTIHPSLLISQGIEPHVYYEAATVIITFILLGKYLEEKAKSNSSAAIKKLIQLQPQTVVRYQNDTEEIIDLKEVQVNDLLLVKPGQKIPVDGVVTRGESYVDESSMTGEPIAVHKMTDDSVLGGTINQNGILFMKAEKVGQNTLLARIIDSVKKAQSSKAPVQKLADKIAGVFVPVVILIAVLSSIIWIISGYDQSLSLAFLAFITVLVIACPCALGLATPTALVVGMGKGAEQGILIKDAETLEKAKHIDTVVLDKTGTITTGKPVVAEAKWLVDDDREQLLRILYSLEKYSEHPLSKSILDWIGENTTVEIDRFESLSGKGIKGYTNDREYWVGNQLMAESYLREQHLGNESVFFGVKDQLIMTITVKDQIKTGSEEAITKLKKLGLEIHLLSGDREKPTSELASLMGIDKYRSQTLPNEKAAYIRELQASGKVVAMIGDGINDAEALAHADVSIAMGEGTDIAIDVAKISLVGSNLSKVPTAIHLARKTYQTIRQNLFWAFLYNSLGIPVAAGLLYPVFGFLLNPMIAGGAMALSSVSVLTNSLRLKFHKLL
jgi:Cu2+-exporting ATPase